MYVVFYLLPLSLVDHVLSPRFVVLFDGVWIFAGIIIIAAVAGYVSQPITIWEPAIAGAVFFAVCFIANGTLSITIPLLQDLAPPSITLTVIFIVSLYGAWWGENAQRLWRTSESE
jgi:hypothetical protein